MDICGNSRLLMQESVSPVKLLATMHHHERAEAAYTRTCCELSQSGCQLRALNGGKAFWTLTHCPLEYHQEGRLVAGWSDSILMEEVARAGIQWQRK
jgi:hypothetical protein